MKYWKHSLLGISAVMLAACGNGDEDAANDDAGATEEEETTESATEGGELELVYVTWDSEVASNNVMKLVLEEAGYDTTITTVEQGVMWASVASGDADAHVAGWLPDDMKYDYEQFGDEVVDLGPNLENAQTGLAVPTYMDIDSIEELDGSVVSQITGIDAGAGVVSTTEEALEEYGIDDVTVQTSFDAAMTQELATHIANEEPIVVTAWQPHWKFNTHDLKFLEDPKGIFQEDGEIRTIVREGLEEDDPVAFQILDNFYWTTDDMNAVMLYISEEGMGEEEAAQKWIDDNRETVDEWLDVQ
ncbi:glycine betaine ABC transporter substrate-binding protein [Geomicrobium sediminis]|uniref:Glycine betaine/proline transport system substrate-binding protein n=1 Tax=Geomicrobium sediminis TaxID=1347788 RepID=A0ABS2P9V6_9BACL|nr:glycine betaine ABC transporter substrate-binding protein [Geomicrobium sediminis]MBM7632160.1 glycine betaine/proline transport system substrate-binding protein [Geomicrobium sediminis]